MSSLLNMLPPKTDLNTVEIYKSLNKASRALAELKGEAKTIPNEEILINTLGLQEAKDSSAIENIITTQDDLYRAAAGEKYNSLAAKEVKNYASALKRGFELVKQHRLLTNNYILEIHRLIEPTKSGFRKLPGTVLQNGKGNTVYEPPQSAKEILSLMGNLEKYINDDSVHNIDPLIKMAIIHFQFESIHPFYDGNGRTGRIINVLYLIKQSLLDIPVLYLSKYIIDNKPEYYKLLQNVRAESSWEPWIVWLLKGIEDTGKHTVRLISDIRNLMLDYKHRIRDKYKFYSQDLINNLFKHPYTKIEFVEQDLGVTRKTASSYLQQLVNDNFLELTKVNKTNYYINTPLFRLFTGE
ncbi:Fic family protein [bacterium]|nr:Fic family protein [bacterium]